MNFGGFGFLVGENRAGIRALVVNVHVHDLDAVLGDSRVLHQHHPRVQRPLISPGKQNRSAVQPSHTRYLAVDSTSVGGGGKDNKENVKTLISLSAFPHP